MATIYEIRRANMRALVRDRGASSVAAAAGYANTSYISQVSGPTPTRDISEKSARMLEEKLGLPVEWFDTERDAYGRADTKPAALNSMLDVERLAACLALATAAMPDSPPVKVSRVALMGYESGHDGTELQNYISQLALIAK